MATENPQGIITVEASGTVEACRFVIFGAAGVGAQCAVDNAKVDGVSRYKALTGTPLSVATGGIVLVEAGAVVADAALVMSDSSGRAITATVGTKKVLGKVVNGTSAAAAGDMLAVQLFGQAQYDTAAA